MTSNIAIAPTVGTCPALDALEQRSPLIEAHLRDCAGCRIVDELLGLRRDNDPSICNRVEDLIAARNAGAVASGVDAFIEAHVATCVVCRAVSETVLSASAALAGDHTSLPPVSPDAYALGRELARGGMGRILEARDLRVGRPVAVKELLGTGAGLAVRFEREARVTACLQHPGIVPIYEIGTWPDGKPFYSMRLIEGTTLGAAITNANTLDERLALLPAVITAAEAIAFAHARHVIHRDLTPANIMLGAFGETVVIDWGLAKDLDADEPEDVEIGPYRSTQGAGELTAAGAVIGTAAYMPPEQAAGQPVDERGDVYALGAVLYHLLTGHAPYRGTGSAEILGKLRTGVPEPIDPAAPRDLASIVEKAMRRERAERYPSAGELVAELRRFQTGRIVEAHAYSRGELARRWLRRHRALVVGAACLVVALAGTGALWFRAVVAERSTAIAERDRAATSEERASTTAVALLEEQGRQYFLAGDDRRALAYFDAALQAGRDTPELRLMIGTALQAIERPRDAIACAHATPAGVARSHDGTRLAGLCGGTLRVWTLAPRALAFELPAPGATSVAFSDDDRWLATSGPAAIAVDVATGTPRRTVTLAGGWTNAIGFAKDTLVVHGRTSLATVDLASERAPVERPFGTAQAFRGTLPLRGTTTGVYFEDHYDLIDVAGETVHVPFRDPDLRPSDLSPDGATFVRCGDGRATLAARRDNHAIRTVEVADATEQFTTCRFDPTGARFLTATDNGAIETWSTAGGPRLGHFTVAPGFDSVRFVDLDGVRGHAIAIERANAEVELRSLGGHLLARLPIHGALVPGGDGLVVVDAAGLEPLPLDRIPAWGFEPPPGHTALASNDAGDRVITWTYEGAFTLWNARTGAQLAALPAGAPPAFSHDGTRIVTATAGHALAIVDATTGAIATELPVQGAVTSVGCDRTCAHAFASDATRTLVWNVATRAPLATIAGEARGDALSADGTRLAVRVDMASVAVVDVGAGKPLATMAAAGSAVGFAAGGALVAFQGDGVLAVLDVATGRRATFASSFARFDATRSYLTSYGNGRIELWTTAPFAQLHAAEVAPVVDVSRGTPVASPDGAFVLDGGTNAMLVVRSARDGRVLSKLGEHRAVLMPDRQPMNAPPHWHGADAVVGFGLGVAAWTLPIEHRAPDAIHALVSALVPWRVEHGALVAAGVSSIAGRVARGGRGVPNVPVVARWLDGDRSFAATTDADGAFTVAGLPPGAYAVSATSPDEVSAPQAVRAGGRVEIALHELVALVLEPYDPTARRQVGTPPATSLLVHNARATAISVSPIDLSGTPTELGQIAPGHSLALAAVVGQQWLVRDAAGANLGMVVAGPPGRVEIQ